MDNLVLISGLSAASGAGVLLWFCLNMSGQGDVKLQLDHSEIEKKSCPNLRITVELPPARIVEDIGNNRLVVQNTFGAPVYVRRVLEEELREKSAIRQTVPISGPSGPFTVTIIIGEGTTTERRLSESEVVTCYNNQ